MYPVLTLQPRQGKRARDGHPWIYSNELAMDANAKALVPGSIVRIDDANGRALGLAHFNPRTLIAARLLARGLIADVKIDTDFWTHKIRAALDLRAFLVDAPYYRLAHAEADGLPGLVIDRFGKHVVVQANTAGMQAAKEDLCAALENVLHPQSIVWRGEGTARSLEGLADDIGLVTGEVSGPVELQENGLAYKADLLGGQKTGWFYDQRRNRALVASFARGKRVLDLYTHTGGFGLLAAHAGAAHVTCVDRSEPVLDLAALTAAANGLANVGFVKEDIFDFCAAHKDARFDVVIADPPAFAKSKKDVGPASRGYRKLARLAASLLAPNGFFFMASCSHAITRERFDDEVISGLRDAGRMGAILARTGADLDHPTHPHLPESSYLKGILLHVD